MNSLRVLVADCWEKRSEFWMKRRMAMRLSAVMAMVDFLMGNEGMNKSSDICVGEWGGR